MGRRCKVTMACEACRGRKARCSGSQPCEYCHRHDLECVFNRQRNRRGPQPQLSQQPTVVNEQVAKPTVIAAAQPPIQPVELLYAASSSDPADSAGWSPEGSLEELPTLDQRHKAVELCIRPSLPVSDELGGISTELICHLIELFFSHVQVQQPPILLEDVFFNDLKGDKPIAALCFAMCSIGVHYLAHNPVSSFSRARLGSCFRKKARDCLVLLPRDHSITRLRSQCVLALSEMHRSNGSVAWYDLAIAKVLLQIEMASPKAVVGRQEDLSMIATFLHTLESIQIIGNPKMFPCRSMATSSLNHGFLLDTEFASSETVERNWIDLLELQIHIELQVSDSFTSPSIPHWHSDSPFRKLQFQLDELLLRNPDDLCSTRDVLDQWLDQGCITRIHVSLTWHCCIILLNRGFLPVRVPQRRDGPGSHSEPPLQISYPDCPSTFAAERRNLCVASAGSISTICDEVMARGHYLPTPYMGYTCYLSSMILLDQLHEPQQSDWADAMDHLQINFALLAALRKFFLPADDWISKLLSAQKIRPDSLNVPPDVLFSNYFARFQDLSEAPMIPLDVSEDPRAYIADEFASNLQGL